MARPSHTTGRLTHENRRIPRTHGQWVTLYEADEMTYGERLFVKDFAEGDHSHASIGSASVNRKHFSAFRIVGGKPEDDGILF